ncbi:MAG: glycosyltransferase [Armatimonadota bacterium]|nr:glycosyltransferase [Armatimonadota bacterium]
MRPVGSPRVSVCVPVYNGARYLRESLESVLAQTYGDFELVVSDNCSTDETPEITASLKDDRLRYFRNPTNVGLVGNFNRCLALARGEYVCIWAHDDVMLPQNLQRKVRLLDGDTSLGFVHSNILQIDDRGRVLAEHWALDSRRDYHARGIDVFRRYAMAMVNVGSIVFIGAVLARRVCYERLGGYREGIPFTCDGEMLMRMLLYYDTACIGQPLVKYRIHAGMITTRFRGPCDLEQHYLATRFVFDEHRERIPQCECLRRQVMMAFSERGIRESLKAVRRGRPREAIAYLALALRAHSNPASYPWLLWRAVTGRLATRIAEAQQ